MTVLCCNEGPTAVLAKGGRGNVLRGGALGVATHCGSIA